MSKSYVAEEFLSYLEPNDKSVQSHRESSHIGIPSSQAPKTELSFYEKQVESTVHTN